MITNGPTARRGFLGKVAAAAVAAGLPWSRLEATGASLQDTQDQWLSRLNGKHRCLFDMLAHNDGLPMVHILNYMNTYNSAYRVPDSDLSVVGTFYGFTTLHGVNDAMWAKYKIGAAMNINDPVTGAPATRNPWRTSVHALGMDLPGASTEALQKRGVTFLLCNNALTIFSGELAKGAGAQQPAVYQELRANMLPGVVLVPAMVIAIEKAQAAGLAYNKQ